MGIETAIGTALITAGLSASTASAVAAGIVTIGSAVLVGAANLGINALLAPGAPRRTAVNVPSRQNVQQSTPRERYCYGRALMGGATCFAESKPPYIIYQYLVEASECEAIAGVIVNGRVCEFNSNGDAVTPFFNKNGTSYLKISVRLGADDQLVDPLLLAEFPDTDASFRQRGICTVTLRAYYGADRDDHEETWGTSQFNPQFIVKGRKVYDPRDFSQVEDDESTWKWSDNWALCMADWVRAPFGGRKKSSQIDYEKVALYADICDEPIGLSTGGTEPRYTMNGAFLSDEDPFGVLDDMLRSAGQGAVIWHRGKFWPLPDHVKAPVITITQSDLAGGFEYVASKKRRDALNAISTEFIFGDRNFKAAVTPTLERPTLIASDGERLESQVSRPFLEGPERAQRMDKIALERSRLGRALTLVVSLRHLALEPGDNIRVQLVDFSFADGVYTITGYRRNMETGLIELQMIEDNPEAVHAWDPLSEVQDYELDEAA